MSRIEEVIAEVDAAREAATRKFAAEVNMPLADFRRHFQVVLELAAGDEPTVSFRVEPKEEDRGPTRSGDAIQVGAVPLDAVRVEALQAEPDSHR